MSRIFDQRSCKLGEGPLWHPERDQLFWFDILNKRLLSRSGDEELCWQFDEHVSAAGWIDRSRLLIASETKLFQFNVETHDSRTVALLESEDPTTRSNDGRADPFGGFWIGTMGKNGERNAGAIYRYYGGEVHKLYAGVTISNAICFAPDASCAYFTDTLSRTIKKVALDKNGWPTADPETAIDLNAAGQNPDGAVADSEGNLWVALWGDGRVAKYTPEGTHIADQLFNARQITCPAFGGPNLSTLHATSAAIDLEGVLEGLTFAAGTHVTGQREHQVRL